MATENHLSLQVSSSELDAFCKKIISRSRNTGNTHEALNVLEAFVSAFSSDSQGSDNYQSIQKTLKSHSEKTREKLMQEKAQQLQQGLINRNCALLAQVYNALSRNGFYQNLTAASEIIEPDQITGIASWAIQWTDNAKKKAEEASGYPDALDFKKAQIAIEEYQAMSDIAYFFKHTYSF